jgi:hypothetical protein
MCAKRLSVKPYRGFAPAVDNSVGNMLPCSGELAVEWGPVFAFPPLSGFKILILMLILP